MGFMDSLRSENLLQLVIVPRPPIATRLADTSAVDRNLYYDLHNGRNNQTSSFISMWGTQRDYSIWSPLDSDYR